MSAPAGRPIREQHPLLLDRERLDAVTERMWIHIQRVIFPQRPRRIRRSPAKTELTIVGGTSAEDVLSEAVLALLRFEPEGNVNWEAVGATIAHRRAVAAVRAATKHRQLEDGSEINITPFDLQSEEGHRVADKRAALDDLTDDEAVDHVIRAERLLAFRTIAAEILAPRDRDIVFRVTRDETHMTIASDVGLTPQRVGQIYRESLAKINARLRSNPRFRRLYEPEGGNPDG